MDYVELAADVEAGQGAFHAPNIARRRILFVVSPAAALMLVLAFCSWTEPASNPVSLWSSGGASSAAETGASEPASHPVSLWSFGGALIGAETGAEAALNRTRSAAQRANAKVERDNPSVAKAERKAAAGAKTAADAFNKTESAALEKAKKVGKETSSVVQRANAKAVRESPMLAKAEKQTASASQAATNFSYTIPPLCLDAMELGFIVASGAVPSPMLMSALGFKRLGVEAKTLGTVWQSTMGNVKKGSTFSRLQSAGARGLLYKSALHVTGVDAVGSSAFCAGVTAAKQSAEKVQNNTAVAKAERAAASTVQKGEQSAADAARRTAHEAQRSSEKAWQQFQTNPAIAQAAGAAASTVQKDEQAAADVGSSIAKKAKSTAKEASQEAQAIAQQAGYSSAQ